MLSQQKIVKIVSRFCNELTVDLHKTLDFIDYYKKFTSITLWDIDTFLHFDDLFQKLIF